ncbi:hydrophobe/amphiphile efflux-1 family RND transporter [Chitinophaga parva]|uniref:Hydrophobe/amphiphile efflux-1 family RND transporter n=1 Tax=Chitinophaga parva TaxID=2169414 RepID=A0A2T7BIW8_9BACT|nr:multidrug efflux RND transporter permease subunit [Chitinophaga parva]PUZ26231.1 hydrophobe/amphiphile efflux-1 family RND transporter [Chitinophaga parva]
MIADTFIRRPVTAIVISVVLVLVGLLAMINLPIGQYPEISPPTVQVTGTYIGADAQTVEQTTATPVEVQVNGTPGMTYMTSNSTSAGSMSLTVNFEVGTDINIAALDVQNRVGIATPTLPQEVQRIGLTVRKRNPSILMLVALFSPKGTHDITFLDNYTNIYLKDALLRAKGVGDIFTRADDFSMRIWLNPSKLAQMGVTADDIKAAISEQNQQIASGSVGTPPQQMGQTFEYSIIVKGRLVTPEEFGNIIVKTRPSDGAVVYMKDVARVELGKFNYSGNSFVDGKRASYLLVYQAPGSNAISTADAVIATMEQLKKAFPKDVDYVVPFESVTVVRVSIHEVVETLLIALVLVIIVVFLFLQSWRATLIPVLAIPVSIIATFIFFFPLNFTINTLTLFGFVLAIGIVVDDAIVVVEAVQHNMDHEGMSPRDATHRAMEEISGPVIAIALILCAVFVPVGFIPGIVGRLYQQFAITIAISVLISAFVALSLTPALCTLLLKPSNLGSQSRGLNKFFYRFNVWFGHVTSRYSVGVKKVLRHSALALALLGGIIVAAYFLFASKSTGFIPTEDDGRIYITFDLPESSSTERTVTLLRQMMHELDSVPEIGHYAALGGLNAITFASKSNSATIFCQLKPWDDRKQEKSKIFALVARLQQQMSKFKEANVVVIPPPAIPGLGNTGGFSFELEQKGAGDIKEFESVLRTFVAAANQRKELSRPFSFFTARTPGYQLEIDREKAKKLGIPISAIASALQTYMGSVYINDFTIYGRNFRVVAQADSSFRGNMTDLAKYYVRNQNGDMVPLSTVTSYKVIESAPVISHYNLFRSAEINGNAAPGYSSGDAIKALQEVAAQVLPEGYGYEFSGLSREEILSGSKTVYIFALSIVFVFLFLAALYESWSVPFSVLLAVPLGVFGAIAALHLAGPTITNNVYAQIGLITLIGLAAKNAILIVEFAKERVDRGMDVMTATVEAAKLRLRPIIMTSLAFLLGILPLVFASGAGAYSRKTMGVTVLGGMLAATFLAIFMVPVLYLNITRWAYGKAKLEEMKKKFNSVPDHDAQGHV